MKIRSQKQLPHQYPLAGVLAFIFVICTTPVAMAGDHSEKIMSRLDKNGDNLISLDEFHSPRGGPGARLLERADLNNDGSVTLDEARSAHSMHKAERKAEMAEHEAEENARFEGMMSEVDNNGDGIITADEMRGLAFKRMDKNEDGFISAEEFRRPGFRGDKHRRDQRMGQHPMGNHDMGEH